MALIAFVSTVRTLDFFWNHIVGRVLEIVLVQNLRTNYLRSRTVPDKKPFHWLNFVETVRRGSHACFNILNGLEYRGNCLPSQRNANDHDRKLIFMVKNDLGRG